MNQREGTQRYTTTRDLTDHALVRFRHRISSRAVVTSHGGEPPGNPRTGWPAVRPRTLCPRAVIQSTADEPLSVMWC
jgi:hypothetical protein